MIGDRHGPQRRAHAVRVLDAGDAALTIEFGQRIDPIAMAAVDALDRAVTDARGAGRLPGLIETVPTFRSLTVCFDPLVTRRAEVLAVIEPLLDAAPSELPATGRSWRLPVCYGAGAENDLAAVAAAIGTTADGVIDLHCRATYRVHMLGFLPGFAFMGDVAGPLRLPRRATPRVRVPAGSVAVANELTAIYPWESPGGWHLLGRCPVPLFDAAAESPALLAVGDRVEFEPIDAAELARIDGALVTGTFDRSEWLVEPDQ